jgi:hypothetical protein
MMNSTESGRHSRTIETLGSGTSIRWLGEISAVLSNQKAAISFRTCPLKGRVPTTTSKQLTRSVTTIVRRSPRT